MQGSRYYSTAMSKHERSFANVCVLQVWSVGAGGDRYQRWWGEQHLGHQRVRRHGHSTTGEGRGATERLNPLGLNPPGLIPWCYCHSSPDESLTGLTPLRLLAAQRAVVPKAATVLRCRL